MAARGRPKTPQFQAEGSAAEEAAESPAMEASEQMSGNARGASASQDEHPPTHKPYSGRAPFTP